MWTAIQGKTPYMQALQASFIADFQEPGGTVQGPPHTFVDIAIPQFPHDNLWVGTYSLCFPDDK